MSSALVSYWPPVFLTPLVFGRGKPQLPPEALGLGCAPVYPCLLHETPQNFGKDVSQAIMGIQMACAYMGSTLMLPLFGLITENIGIAFYPVYLMVFAAIMLLIVEKLNAANKRIARQTSVSER
jgi:fucose permease